MQVSNVEVYYRAVSFYLEQHPDLLVDLLKVCIWPATPKLFCMEHYSTGSASNSALNAFLLLVCMVERPLLGLLQCASLCSRIPKKALVLMAVSMTSVLQSHTIYPRRLSRYFSDPKLT